MRKVNYCRVSLFQSLLCSDFWNRCIFNLDLLLISGVKEWIRTCLPRNPDNERSLLVWDSFRAHLTESVKADLRRRNFNVAVIPGGLTPVLQPLDKCLNKPFKDSIRRQYLSWMMTGPFEFTPAGKKKAPSRNPVLQWIKQSRAEIPAEMVRKSFKTCGISNALDNTEDDEVELRSFCLRVVSPTSRVDSPTSNISAHLPLKLFTMAMVDSPLDVRYRSQSI